MGCNANLSAFSSLKPSSIDNKYDIPIAIPIVGMGITVSGSNTDIEREADQSKEEIGVFGSVQSSANTPGPLLHRSQTTVGGNAWSPWGSLGGGVRGDSQPAVIKNADGRLASFIVNSDNAVYYKRQILAGSASWSGWTYLGGNVRAGSEIAVGIDSNNRLVLFIINADNKVFFKQQTLAGSDNWSGWTNLGADVKAGSEIAISKYPDGKLVVFIINSNNAVYYRQQIAPGSDIWSGWTFLGGNARTDSNPVVDINNNGRLEAFHVRAGAASANQPPTADSKSVTTNIGTPVEITLSGQDPENSPLTFIIVRQPLHAQQLPLVVSPQNKVVYTPTSGFSGSDSFTYVARDNQGATSPTAATVSITVSSGGGGGNGGNDQFGIRKIYPDGPFNMNAQFIEGRQDGSSNRWNVASDEPPGAIPSPQENVNYEVTMYAKVAAAFDGFNLKFWGPHHGSSGIPYPPAGSSTPCCWYDIGIDSDGAVKTQIEYPHPINIDVPNPGPIKNIGSIVNEWIGVKWIIYKMADGNRKVELWYDQGGLDSSLKPSNQWVQLLDKIDTGDWLPIQYSPPAQQEIELRVRDVSPQSIQMQYLYARDITSPGT
jgi:Bacterial Ig domain